MRLVTKLIGASLLCAAVVGGCKKVPYTRRTPVNAIPNALMNAVGAQSYVATLSEVNVKKGGKDDQTLSRVGGRISRVANKPNYDWEYALIDDASVNAWCMPGGKIGFYTGILPVLEHESGMAFVMGHEVAHAVAAHGGERMTQQLGVMGGLTVLQAYVDGKSKLTAEQKQILFGALGLGAEVGVLLPFSRMHEKEADVIGMMYMADAGYPPGQAPEVWTRMGQLGGERPPTFLSTHPSPEGRKANLAKWLPDARKKYLRNKLDGNVTAQIW